MPYVDAGERATLTVDPYDETTTATLHVVPPDRSTPIGVGVDTTDGGNTWTGIVPAYTVPGLWWHVWTVTGTGAGKREISVSVEPRQASAAAPRAYATTTQLADYFGVGEPIPADSEGKLHRATVRIDRLLRSAVYPVDADGEPADAGHQAALAEAVCELVAHWVDAGDESGFLAGGGTASVGSMSISSHSRSGGKGVNVGGSWVPSHAIAVLQNAGLWGHTPWIY